MRATAAAFVLLVSSIAACDVEPGEDEATAEIEQALAGDPDGTFGTGGKVQTDLGGNDQAKDVAIQSNGKIVVVGGSSSAGAWVARYNADGSIDTGFSGGKRFLAHGSQEARGVALQSDGKIVVCGVAGVEAFVARLKTDGSFDNTFDNDGYRTLLYDAFDTRAEDIAIQSDGKIVVAGWTVGIISFGPKFTVIRPGAFVMVRLNGTDGLLDSTFNDDGFAFEPYHGAATNKLNGVVLMPGGRILGVGMSSGQNVTPNGSDSRHVALVRWTSTGALDTGFGQGGVRITPVGSPAGSIESEAQAVALQADGKIVVAGYSFAFVPQETLALRYSSSGSIDTSFGSGGIVEQPFAGLHSGGSDLVLDANGNLLISGAVLSSANVNNSITTLVKLKPSGAPDGNFGGGDGVAEVVVGGTSSAGAALALQNGRPVVVGQARNGSNQLDTALVRFRP